MSVQINIKKIPKPWKPGIYFRSDIVIFEDYLYFLSPIYLDLYTSHDFNTEFLNGDWLKI